MPVGAGEINLTFVASCNNSEPPECSVLKFRWSTIFQCIGFALTI